MLIKTQEKTPAYADVIYPVFDFSGGLNTKSTPLFLSRSARFALHPNQCLLLDNWARTSSGALTSRPCLDKLNSSAISPPSGDSEIRSIAELRTADGTDRIVVNAGNSIYYWDGSSFTSVGTTLTNNRRFHWTQFRDVLIGVNGIDVPVAYDGTSLSTLSGTFLTNTVSCVISHRGRVWALDGQTLRYSAENSYTDWSTSNNAGTLRIPTKRGQGGTAILSLWDRLIVWTNGEVFQLFGTSPQTFNLAAINFRYGNEGSPYAVVAAGNDIYFPTKRGVHALSVAFAQSDTGDVQADYVSSNIEPTWQDITPANFPNIVGADATRFNCVIYLCNQNGTQNSQALIGDYYHRDSTGAPTWARWTGIAGSSITEVRSLNALPEVLIGGYDGFVYRLTNDNEVDDTTTSTANVQVQLQYLTDLEQPGFDKLFRHLVLFTQASVGTMYLNSSFDFGARVLSQSFNMASTAGDMISTTFTIGVSSLGTIAFTQNRVSVPGVGRFVTFNYSASLSRRVTFGGFIIYAGLRRVLR